jgi:hypothetical protein
VAPFLLFFIGGFAPVRLSIDISYEEGGGIGLDGAMI